MKRHTRVTSRQRLLPVERERDIAIEEAALACYELNHARKELETLRREKQQWEAGHDAWSQRQQQFMWHVGAMAEALWHAIHCALHDGATPFAVEDARLLALESVEQLVVKSDAQLYEEMHELYAKIARKEAQQTVLTDKIHDLTRINDDLSPQQQPPPEVYAAGEGEDDPGLTKVFLEHTDEVSSDRQAPTSYSEDVAMLQAQLAMYIQFAKRHRVQPSACVEPGGQQIR